MRRALFTYIALFLLSACGGESGDLDGGGGVDGGGDRDSGHDSGPPVCTEIAERVVSTTAPAGRPALVVTDDGYALAWSSGGVGSAEIRFVRLDRAGAPVGDDARLTDGARPDLVWTGDGFGVSFVRDGSIPPTVHFMRLDEQGALVGSVVDIGEGDGVSSIVFTGSAYGVAYMAARGGGQSDIYLARFDASGGDLGDDLLTISDEASFIPTLGWTGTQFGVSYIGTRAAGGGTFFLRIDANGAPVGTEVRAGDGGAPRLAAGPSGFAVAFSAAAPAGALVLRGNDGAAIGTAVALPATPSEITWAGDRYAYVHAIAAEDGVYVGTVDPESPTPSAPIEVSTGSAAEVNALSIAYDNLGYAVAWADDRDTAAVYFARVCD